MQAPSTLHQVLYISHLAPPHEYDAFTAICRSSRHRNAALGVTGVLLFDGHRFCQLLQGPAPAVQTLMADIARDARHEQIVTLFDGAVPASSASRSWTAGYCETHELDVFDHAEGARGDSALLVFNAVLARADLEP
jgi:hypothetical protein